MGVGRFTAIIEPDDDGVYIAAVPSVPGVVEQGESAEEAMQRLKEALAFHLEYGSIPHLVDEYGPLRESLDCPPNGCRTGG